MRGGHVKRRTGRGHIRALVTKKNVMARRHEDDTTRHTQVRDGGFSKKMEKRGASGLRPGERHSAPKVSCGHEVPPKN